MLRLLDLRDARPERLPAELGSVAPDDDLEALATVREIIAEVRAGGDGALRRLTARLDGCEIEELVVGTGERRAALASLPTGLRIALETARDRVAAYHRAQEASLGSVVVDDGSGVRVRELVLPVSRAGLYVPGGRARYPSSVLMTAVPARVAGVAEVLLCVPPDRSGAVPAVTLAAAELAGVDAVYRVGGAQAIAALAYGTESIPPVDVVVGPGNRYVALAKREVAGVVGIEAVAGPSELVVIADGSAPASYAALDLVAQAEHGPGGTAVLVTWDPAVVTAVDAEVARALERVPRREEILATLGTGGRAVLVAGPEQAVAASDAVAPEHLELLVADPDALLPLVRNAGAVFCGPWAPAVLGDYAAGPSHVLPTGRSARFSSALRVDDFVRHVHVVDCDERGIARLGPPVEALAAAEGLDAHARAVAARRGEDR